MLRTVERGERISVALKRWLSGSDLPLRGTIKYGETRLNLMKIERSRFYSSEKWVHFLSTFSEKQVLRGYLVNGGFNISLFSTNTCQPSESCPGTTGGCRRAKLCFRVFKSSRFCITLSLYRFGFTASIALSWSACDPRWGFGADVLVSKQNVLKPICQNKMYKK